MHRPLALALTLSLALAAPAIAMTTRPESEPSPAASAAVSREHWQGELKFGGQSLVISVTIGELADGGRVGTIDIPAQGVKGMPIDQVVKTDTALSFAIPKAGARFEGRIVDDQAVGHWKQGGASLPLTLAPASAAAELKRPQTPQPPFPYRAVEVTYPNPKAGNQLAGTLTLPEGQGPFPAVLLITGSGAQDRDQTILGHKSFLVIADHLTRRGIAVLRVDDRGVGGSTGNPNGTSLDFATDVEAGLAFLKGHPAIRQGQIGLLGHSEGGLIAPIVAARHPQDVAFLVLLAAQATTGGEAVMDQVKVYAEAMGEGKATVDRKLAFQMKIYEILRQHDPQAAVQPLRALLADYFDANPEGKQQIEAQIQAINSPWFRTFIDLDPRPYLTKIQVPVLAINGSKDTQVLADRHLPGLKGALKESPSVKIYELPGLNHLFQPAKTGLPTEYGQIETTFDPAALELIGDWVEARTSRK